MATVYIAPTAQGSANGTSEANAYAYSSLSSAESDAGDGGTIYFLDGNYPMGTSGDTFDGGNNLTYESLNLHGASLGVDGTSKGVSLGAFGVGGTNINLKKFKLLDTYFNSHGANTHLIKDCLHTQSLGRNLATASVFYCQSGSTLNVETSIIQPKVDTSGYRFFQDDSNGINITNCVFNVSTTNSPTDIRIYSMPTGVRFKNVIFKCDADSAIASDLSGNFTSRSSNCCFFQFGSQNDSGGTSNLYDTDPLFVDAPNNDFRLRPSSPCINAGTA